MRSLWLLAGLAIFFCCGCRDKSELPKKLIQQRFVRVPCDDFNLPLVIQIDTPKVPPEIQKPSGPIDE
jgi:hypothetical protein